MTASLSKWMFEVRKQQFESTLKFEPGPCGDSLDVIRNTRIEEEGGQIIHSGIVTDPELICKPRYKMTLDELATTGPEFRCLYHYLWWKDYYPLTQISYKYLSLQSLRTLWMAEEAKVVSLNGICIIEKCLPLRISISVKNLEDNSWMISRERFFDHRRFSCEYAMKPGDITRWWNLKYKPEFHTGFNNTHEDPVRRTREYKHIIRISKDWDTNTQPHKSRYDLLKHSREEYTKIGGGAYSQTRELRELNSILTYDLQADAWTLLLNRLGGDYMKILRKHQKELAQMYEEDQLKTAGYEFLTFLLSDIDPALHDAVPDWMKFE